MHMRGITDALTSDIKTEIARMKAKASEFMAAYRTLDAQRPDPEKYPVEFAKWQELKTYGDNTRAAIERITGTIDTAGNIIDSIYYGITHPFGTNPFGLNGLGILPLIPAAGTAITVAVIGSTIAAMTYFITQAYEYGKFADSPPEVRAALTKRAATTGLAPILSNVKGILIVGALIYFAPKILEMMKGRK